MGGQENMMSNDRPIFTLSLWMQQDVPFDHWARDSDPKNSIAGSLRETMRRLFRFCVSVFLAKARIRLGG